jgi:hypothetical protein
MRRLRKARRHSFPARLYLDVASADGRKVRTTTTFTLDGQKRFGTAPRAAKAAC